MKLWIHDVVNEGLCARLDVTIALWMVLVARAKLARCVGATEEDPAQAKLERGTHESNFAGRSS